MTGFLFTEELRRKVLKGEKTQTRRVLKPGQRIEDNVIYKTNGHVFRRAGQDYPLPLGRGKMGTWVTPPGLPLSGSPFDQFFHDPLKHVRLTTLELDLTGWQAREWLEAHHYREYRIHVLRIWQESVCQISDEDAQAEGFDYMAGYVNGGTAMGLASPRYVFAKKWDTINNRDGLRFRDNPQVACYEFQTILKEY